MSSRLVVTAATAPGDRGREFGRARAEQVRASWRGYLRFFEAGGLFGREQIEGWGDEALAASSAWAPEIGEEIEGIAAGAGLTPEAVGALNARTELLARVARRVRAELPSFPAIYGRKARKEERGECSVLVALEAEGGPLGAQTWDWHEELAAIWVVWGFETAAGMRVQTLTEAGMLAKIGVNSAGIAVLLNVLHHDDDASVPLGIPIHILLRRLLAESETILDAVRILAAAPVAASSAVTLIAAEGGEETALTAELRPGAKPDYLLPDEAGLLVHTNHFLASAAVPGDREPTIGPDSLFRLELLRRRAARLRGTRPGPDELLAPFDSHLGRGGAICCHPEPGAPSGERYMTLATVVVDPLAGRMRFAEGGPCEATGSGWTEVSASVPTTKEALDVRTH
ncbi:MAG: isopenicillin-N N-acyltransferase like protein [Solirubrobacterales bacterium]|nr:isopenicillin-N N-acyltransferase like protein [Solirubrobacterales bacterium]